MGPRSSADKNAARSLSHWPCKISSSIHMQIRVSSFSFNALELANNLTPRVDLPGGTLIAVPPI